ncbi:MAG: PD40 domain-containing protein [Acidobacteria bacterium]|nr:PD40 domain-containing protein [Acidobacteriota bacterium]
MEPRHPNGKGDSLNSSGDVSSSAILAQVDKILVSKEFAHSDSLRRFLRYAVHQVMECGGDRLKEYVLGVELFGRGDTFDPRIDPIVRVQAGKLRTRLQQYYADEGRSDTVVIDLPKGGYVPVFRRQDARQATAGGAAGTWIRKRTVWAALVLLSAAAVVTVAWWQIGSQTPAPVFTQLTFATGSTSAFPAISREGKVLAFASDRGEEGKLDIYVQALGVGGPVQLTHDPAKARQPDFSPDGTRIVFQSGRDGGGIYVISLLSREEKKIADLGFLPRFSPDGSWVAYQGPGGRIYTVSANGGQARAVPTDLNSGHYPVWTPDGKHLLVLTTVAERPDPEFDWRVVPLSGAPSVSTGVREVFRRYRLGTSRYPPVPGDWVGDRLIFSAGQGLTSALWQIPISTKTWRVAGPPERLTSGPGAHTFPRVAVESRGRPRIVFTNQDVTTHIWGLSINPNHPEAGGHLTRLTQDASLHQDDWGTPQRLSADGTKLVFCSARSGNPDVWLKDLASGRETPLTANPWPEVQPLMAADGSKVAYVSLEKQSPAIYVVGTAGGVSEKVCDNCGYPLDWTSGSGLMLIAEGQPARLVALSVPTGQKQEVLGGLKYTLREAALSPDGRWIAVRADGLAGEDPFVAPFRSKAEGGPAEWVALKELRQGWGLRWSPDGRFLYFFANRDGFPCLWAQPLHAETRRPMGRPIPVHHFHRYQRYPWFVAGGISAAADKLALWLDESASNIWMTELGIVSGGPR